MDEDPDGIDGLEDYDPREELAALSGGAMFDFDEGALYVFSDRSFPDRPAGALKFYPESAFFDADAWELGGDPYQTPAAYDMGFCARAEVEPAFGPHDLATLSRIAASEGAEPVAVRLSDFEEAASAPVSGERRGMAVSAADAGVPPISEQCVEGGSIMVPMAPALAGRIAQAIREVAKADPMRAERAMRPSEWLRAQRELEARAQEPISGRPPIEPPAPERSARGDIAASREAAAGIRARGERDRDARKL